MLKQKPPQGAVHVSPHCGVRFCVRGTNHFAHWRACLTRSLAFGIRMMETPEPQFSILKFSYATKRSTALHGLTVGHWCGCPLITAKEGPRTSLVPESWSLNFGLWEYCSFLTTFSGDTFKITYACHFYYLFTSLASSHWTLLILGEELEKNPHHE